MSKARELGWTGYADTWTELVDTFETLEKERVLPPVEQLKRGFWDVTLYGDRDYIINFAGFARK